MRVKALHIIAGIAWVIGSLIAWGTACNLFAFVYAYLVNEQQVRFPDWIDSVYISTAIGGSLLIPPFVAVLAIRAYLPGTGGRGSKLRGFPIDGAEPSARITRRSTAGANERTGDSPA